jgi:hypothetical protein
MIETTRGASSRRRPVGRCRKHRKLIAEGDRYRKPPEKDERVSDKWRKP